MQIEFLTEAEWDAELTHLLREAVNSEGKLKRVFGGGKDDGETMQAVAIDKLQTIYGASQGW